ncbi:uncharacterized protein [Nicotiana sylvestris]|uniref:uncharacterized protein n=1 Tax=Nicotiana sylvestris TaxID=4096 RepID=UPI00388C78AA
MDQIPGAPPVLKGPDSKKYTQLSFKPSTALELIPKWFKMPDVSKYDETSNPQEHIITYTIAVKGNDLAPHEIESVLLKKLGKTLTKGALTWYSLFPEHSIDSFEMLMDSFIKVDVGARKATTWADVHNQYKSKVRIEDDQLGFPTSTKGRDREKNKEKSKNDFNTDPRYSRGQGNIEFSKFFLSQAFRIQLQRQHLELVSAMRNIKEAQFPKPMRSDPSQRDPNLWCKYHGTSSHRSGDCRHMNEEVATLLKNGHRREFLSDQAKKTIMAAIRIMWNLRKQEKILHV